MTGFRGDSIDERSVDWHGVVTARYAVEQTLRRLLGIIEVADLRSFNQRQQNALVLLGSELTRGRGVHDGGERQHADQDQHGERAEVE